MDAHSLPDDPRDWPTDPFALLGVPRSVSEADLKRAYTRLIRKYKPEHAPDEFRRIREAYEAAIEVSRWYRDAPAVQDTFRDLPFTAVSSPAPESTPREHTQADAPHETEIDPPVRPAYVDPIEVAWADAVAGRWADAYIALVAMSDAHPERADLPLRLYWLLSLRPSLDEARTRHDWLAAALTRARLGGPAVELYRRELAADPHTALYGPYVRLLELPGVTGRHRLALATTRLGAAAPDARWALLDIDLAALAHRSDEFDEGEWLRYLVELAGRAAGERPPLFERCRELLAGLRHLELSHGWAFDLLDHRQLALANLRQARIPEPIRRALSAVEVGADDGKALTAAVAWVASDPFAALRACDMGMTTREGRTFLIAFGQLLADRMERRDEYPHALIRQFVHVHLTRSPVRDSDRAREPLLQFLLTERIDPEELVTACLVDSHLDVRALIRHVREDETLRLIYRAASANV